MFTYVQQDSAVASEALMVIDHRRHRKPSCLWEIN